MKKGNYNIGLWFAYLKTTNHKNCTLWYVEFLHTFVLNQYYYKTCCGCVLLLHKPEQGL